MNEVRFVHESEVVDYEKRGWIISGEPLVNSAGQRVVLMTWTGSDGDNAPEGTLDRGTDSVGSDSRSGG